MNLADLLKFHDTGMQTANTAEQENVQSSSQAANRYRIYSQLRNMMPGDTFVGEVSLLSAEEVQIRLDETTLLTAKMETNANLSVGQNLIFEVKGNHAGQLDVRALFTNVAQQTTVLKAIAEAELPADNQSIRMVSDMMKEGMPIDRKSLQETYHDIVRFSDAKPTDIITLHRLQIPVTKESLIQIENYRNLNHQITDSFQYIADEMEATVQQFLSEGKPQEALRLYGKLMEALISDTSEGTIPTKQETAKAVTEPSLLSDLNTTESGAHITESQTNEAKTKSAEALLNQGTNATKLQEILSPKELQNLAKILQEMNWNSETVKHVETGQLGAREFLTAMVKSMNLNTADFESMLLTHDDRELTKIMKHELIDRMLITPEKVEKPEHVQELFERILKQTDRLSKAVSEVLKPEHAMVRGLAQVRESVDFMSQLNHTLNYVQLPLKLSSNTATGDLYVYTNKKNLAVNDGNVSAYLHLDMDSLGSVDVYVVLSQSKVNTRFAVENDDILDFIEEHLPQLNERLSKKGYAVTGSVSLQTDRKSIAEEMFGTDASEIESSVREEGQQSIGYYSFDVRA